MTTNRFVSLGSAAVLDLTAGQEADLKIALAGAEERGATAELLDLRDYDLPFCTGADVDAIQGKAGVQRLRQKVLEASGIILATPNYHGSLSGVLKNALDLMSMREFEGKVVGLIGVSGGRMGGTSTLNTLRAIGRTLHAWVTLPKRGSTMPIPRSPRLGISRILTLNSESET